jgi:hypothetical protein
MAALLNELKRLLKEVLWPTLKHYNGNGTCFLEGLKGLGGGTKDDWSQDQNLKMGFP